MFHLKIGKIKTALVLNLQQKKYPSVYFIFLPVLNFAKTKHIMIC